MALRIKCKVDHHDGVFLDDANQKHDADGGNQRQRLAKQHQGRQRANRGRWQTRKNGDRVDEALIQHPQQHINHQQGSHNQNGLAGLRALEHGGVATVAGDDGGWHSDALPRGVNFCGGATQRGAGRQIERNRDRLQLADMVDRGRANAALDRGKARQRHQGAAGRTHINATQRALILLGLGLHFHDHLVPIGGQVNGGDLALAKSVEQRGAYGLNRYPQRIGAVPVDLELRLQAAQLRIAGHIQKNGVSAQLILQFGGPDVQFIRLHTLQNVLILRLARAPAQLQILNWAHEDVDARHPAQLAAQPLNDFFHRFALLRRFERDEHAPGVLRATAAVERTHRRHVWIFANDRRRQFLQPHHLRERGVFSGLGRDLDLADVFFREKAFGNDVDQPGRCHKSGQCNREHGFPVAQGDVQQARVGRQQRVEAAFK